MKTDTDVPPFSDIPDPLLDGGAGRPLPARPVIERSSHPWASVRVRRGAALGAAVLSQLVWVEVLNRRDDLGSNPRARVALEFLLPLASAIAAFWAATAPGHRGLGNSRGRIAAWIVGAALLFGLGTWLVTATEEADAIPFWIHVLRCTAFVTAFAAAPFALALWAYARAFVTSASWRTCGLGVACGAVGACTMSFVCETESAAHVLVGHGSAMLIGAVLGALASRRVTMA